MRNAGAVLGGAIALSVVVTLGLHGAVQAQGEERVHRRSYETRRVEGEAPVIDGGLQDRVWESVDWAGDFTQHEPTGGVAPSYQTRFKVLYDDDAVYFAFRIYDDPELVSSLRQRRDSFPGDWIEVNLDSYSDNRSAFSFTLSVSGTRGDELISNDGNNWDTTWDPVWSGATRVDGEGWTAEMKIPLSQVRFSAAPHQTWGLQVQRRLFRLEERSTWQWIPKDRSGWVSNFGELRGLRNLSTGRHIELLPYAVLGGERFEAEEGNPFRDGGEDILDAGLDGKIGLTNNLTIDFTINPDFGQVEADPSEVNLSVFETFFQERRPFFIEGRNIFDLRLAPVRAFGTFTQDNLFYSRRIGRSPGFTPRQVDGTYVDQPTDSTILGAFKLSGKTASGLSLGLLGSLTEREQAQIQSGQGRSQVTVEPLTGYFAGRLQQDFNDGDTQVGGMFTAVHRRLDSEHLNFMRRQAFTGGLDLSTFFYDRDYRLEVTLTGSRISGSEEAIQLAQVSSARYYQRPDNDSATFDPTRTSLSGHGGSIRFERTNNHDLMFQTGVAWRSPGFEINDLGFMRNADQINQFTWVGYAKRNPFGIFDNLNVNFNQWLDWDFGGNFLGARYNFNAFARFRNKWNVFAGLNRAGPSTSNTALRGGPASRWPGSWSANFNLNSDPRRKVAVGVGSGYVRGDEGSDLSRSWWTELTLRPSDPLRISVAPWYARNLTRLQYVNTRRFADQERYIFGRLEQKTLAMTLRVDYSVTANLTVQYYGSPFLSSGRYDELKRITDPQASRFVHRFSVFDGGQLALDPAGGRLEVDENRDGTVDYSFGSPDFDVRDFNSNLVLRWEYGPGSTLFVVWSQARNDADLFARGLDFNRDLRRLFSTHPENVLLIKISKWFSP